MTEYIYALMGSPKFLICAFGGLSLGWFLLFLLIVVLFIKNSKTKNRLKNLPERDTENSLKEKMDEFIEKSNIVSKQEKNIIEKMKGIDSKLNYTLQRVGVYRYNPFPEIGGDLSFSIALLDNTNSGFVITGIYTRQGSFTYLKPVRKGRGNENDQRYRLSKEETEAVNRAIASH